MTCVQCCTHEVYAAHLAILHWLWYWHWLVFGLFYLTHSTCNLHVWVEREKINALSYQYQDVLVVLPALLCFFMQSMPVYIDIWLAVVPTTSTQGYSFESLALLLFKMFRGIGILMTIDLWKSWQRRWLRILVSWKKYKNEFSYLLII